VKERIEDRASAAEVSTPNAKDIRIEHSEKAGWLAPILEPIECSAETWVDLVRNFRKRFCNEARLPKSRQDFRITRRESRVQLVTS